MNAKRSPKRIVFSGDERGEMGKQGNLVGVLDQSTSGPTGTQHPNSSIASRQREAVNDWIQANFQMEMNQGRAFASTFLFMRDIPRQQGEDQYRIFIRALERSFYGKSIERHPDKRGLKHAGIIEGGGSTGKQVHYHSILCNPEDRTFNDIEFMRRVESCWMKTPRAMKNTAISVQIEKIYDLAGWTEYMTKHGTKTSDPGSSYLDMLDLKTLKL